MKTRINLKKALKERDEGIAKVAGKNGTFISTGRGIARLVYRRKGYVTMDQVRPILERRGLRPTHHNAYGAIFRSGEFKPIGYTVSKQVQGHGNKVLKWKVKGGMV